MTAFTEYQFDFETFLGQHGCDVESKSGGEIRGTCPFCGSDSRAPFAVNADSGAWCCFACDERGGPVELVMRLADLPWGDAKDLLASGDWYERGYVLLDDPAPRPDIELPNEFYPLASDTSSSAEPYRLYAHRRGIPDELLHRYAIGYCATGRYARRLVVPVFQSEMLVSFVARSIDEHARLKVLTADGAQQGACLFNVDGVRGLKRVVVVEGVFDALVIPEIAVATFGKRMSDAQAALLLRAGVRHVTFAYDADAAQSNQLMARRFSLTFDADVVVLPDGEDPSSLGRERMLSIIAEQ